MLRFRYMPSDFHPLILVLGSPDDLRNLSAMLDLFAIHRADTRLEQTGFCAPTSTRICLTAGGDRLGVWPVDGEADSFVWVLDADTAGLFAATVNGLIAFGQLSGSEVLECGVIGELPVKVSHGEFTDEFLLPHSTIPV
jgi:hypothetical protein